MSRALASSRVEIPAPVEEVVALRTSDQWVELRAKELRDGSRLVQREARPDGGVDVAISRELPSGVPGFLERFLPKDGRVVQHERWGAVVDGVCTGSWWVEVPGAPAELGGTSSMTGRGRVSVQVVDGQVTVRVPLIGGRAEAFLVDVTQKLMVRENDLLVGHFSR
jgi:hypothetical protein